MYYEITVTQFGKMLNNFLALLDKAVQHAEAKKFDIDVLFQGRLAPDQFNFVRQVQIMCDTAKLGVSRLTGKEAPTHADNERTLPELKARIESTLNYLSTFTAKDFVSSAERRISQPRWEGQYLLGEEYMIQHVTPNFYFHFTTAYSILRHNGVEVGKKDYLGKIPLKK